MLPMPPGLAQAERSMLRLLKAMARSGGDSKTISAQVAAANSVLQHYRWYVDRSLTPELAFLAMFGGDAERANRWLAQHQRRLREQYGDTQADGEA